MIPLMKNIYLLLFCILPLVSCSQSNNNKEAAVPGKPAALKPEEVFTTLKFEMDGKPCVAVINKQYKEYKNKAAFPLSLFLMVNTVDKDQNGHPTEKEAVIFHELQSRIIRELSDAFAYCHVGTTTMNGYRDILLYINSKDQEKASAVLNKIKEENKRLSSYTFEPDAEWEAVAAFYEAVPN